MEPEPLTPPVDGNRLTFTVASPVSFKTFFENATCWPSLAIRLPRTTSFSRKTLGSKRTCKGAAARSVAFSTIKLMVTVPFICALVSDGTNVTRALPAGDAGGGGGAVAGGAVAGGAVAGGDPGWSGTPIGSLTGGALTPGIGGMVCGGPTGASCPAGTFGTVSGAAGAGAAAVGGSPGCGTTFAGGASAGFSGA